MNMVNKKKKITGKINKQREIEQKKRTKRKRTLAVFLILLVVIGIGTYLFISPSFKIQEMVITGNNQLSNEKVLELIGIEKGDNIFMIPGIVMKVKLKQNGYVEDAKINKVYPSKIEIQIQERIKQFQIKMDTGTYINIDEQGYILDSSTNKLDVITILGMDIKENEAGTIKRLSEKDLYKMENILQIREQLSNIQIADKITQIQVQNEYIINLDNDGIIINLGNATNLKDRIYYVNAILKQEAGKQGIIYVNGNLNEGFMPYFREN